MSKDEMDAEWKNIMMESAAYKRLIDEGWDEFWIEAWVEGWKEGWEEGRKSEREGICKLIEKEIGIMPSYLKELILSEPIEKIFHFIRKFSEFQSMDEIEEWWRKQADDAE